jgi:flavin-dependent dehydrogenase
VLSFHTDADLPAARVARNRDALLTRAGQHLELSAVLSDCGFLADTQSSFTAAHSAVLEPWAAPGWMAIGDAALSFDPLSAQGLLSALFTGLASAEAADRHLSNCDGAFDEYIRTINGIFEAYRSHLNSWYKAEMRWSNAEFWRRRQSWTLFRTTMREAS